MKTKKYLFALAMVGMFAFASCTPNSVNDDDNTQQVKTKKLKPGSVG